MDSGFPISGFQSVPVIALIFKLFPVWPMGSLQTSLCSSDMPCLLELQGVPGPFCTFPDPSISPEIPGSFLWRAMFRSQDVGEYSLLQTSLFPAPDSGQVRECVCAHMHARLRVSTNTDLSYLYKYWKTWIFTSPLPIPIQCHRFVFPFHFCNAPFWWQETWLPIPWYTYSFDQYPMCNKATHITVQDA